jgi:hypothetical protein
MVFRGVFYDLSGGGYEETLLLYVSAGAGSNETLARMPPIAIASRPAVFPRPWNIVFVSRAHIT